MIARNVLTNLLLAMRKQSIGLQKMRKLQDKYLKIQNVNFGLIVLIVITNLIHDLVKLIMDLGVHIVLFHLKNYVTTRNVSIVLINLLPVTKNLNIGPIEMKKTLEIFY